MQTVQIRAQFRFNDGDKKKGKYNWEAIPMDEDGNVEDGTYEPKCNVTGGQKAVDYLTIELPDTEAEFAEIPQELGQELMREALVARAKKAQADALRESYESPQQRANREKREKAAFREYLGEKMVAFTEANPGEMPAPELFAKWQEEATKASKG